MKRPMTANLLATGVFAVSLLGAVAFAAPSQQGVQPKNTSANTSVNTSATASAATDTRETRHVDRHCLRHTGSRIVARDNAGAASAFGKPTKSDKRCIAASGRVYGRDDLDRTGGADIAEALRKLDPAIH